jgi:hypothetical protein
VLTDSDFKTTHAYQFLSEVQKLVNQDIPWFKTDPGSFQNLNQCRDQVGFLMNSFLNPKKGNEKLTQAMAQVDEVRLVMEKNVRTMIDQQKGFSVIKHISLVIITIGHGG